MRSYSKAIVESRIVVLTGAGSTAALGLPVMAEFVEVLGAKVAGMRGAHGDRFLDIYKQMTHAAVNRDLERILDLLERYADACSFIATDPNMARFFGGSLEPFRGMVSALDNLTRQTIFETYSEVDAARAFEVFDPFLQVVLAANNSRTLPYFTTNYDAAIEYAVEPANGRYDVRDGFRQLARGFVWEPATIEEYEGPHAQDTVWLFKMHGSVFWYEPDGTREIRKFPSTIGAAPAGHRPVLLYPTESGKVDVPLGEPFDTMYAVLGGCLENAEYCVIVGYSFRDPLLCQLVQRLSGNSRVKFVVVRPGLAVNEAQKEVEQALGTSIIPLPYSFGAEGEHEVLLRELERILSR